MSTSQNESLRDIALLAQQHHGGAGREMERLADQAGKSMSQTTFDRIISGQYRSRPKESTLEALAYLARVPLKRVFAAAGRPYVAAKFADQLPPDVDQLNEDQREALIYTARAFLKANKELERLKHVTDEYDPGSPHLRAVDSSDDYAEGVGVEQKTELPDLEHLAAHHDFVSEKTRFKQEFGAVGEESQDGEH